MNGLLLSGCNPGGQAHVAYEMRCGPPRSAELRDCRLPSYVSRCLSVRDQHPPDLPHRHNDLPREQPGDNEQRESHAPVDAHALGALGFPGRRRLGHRIPPTNSIPPARPRSQGLAQGPGIRDQGAGKLKTQDRKLCALCGEKEGRTDLRTALPAPRRLTAGGRMPESASVSVSASRG